MFHWEYLLAHRHWITVHLFGKKLRLCARCSGIVIGFMCFKFMLSPLISSFAVTFPFFIGFSIAFLFALPSIVDWITQCLGYRQSNNRLRVTTGFFEGVGVWFLNLLNISTISKVLILTVIGLSVLSIGYLGKRRT